MKIAIFCASSSKIDQKYIDATEEIALQIKKLNHSILYGGGYVGLMGKIADISLEEDIDITGVIPRFMVEMKWVHQKLSNLITVDSMFDRKKVMIDSADAILTLPGGVGTLDELLEAITLKQLGQHKKPIIIYNVSNYFNPLFKMLDNMISDNFMRDEHRNLWQVIEHPVELKDALNHNGLDHPDYLNIAQI